jgi:hypothetical protein
MDKHIVCIPLSVARDRGLKNYAIPRKCSNGHFEVRSVSARSCRQCLRDAQNKRAAAKELDKDYVEARKQKRRHRYRTDPEFRKKAAKYAEDYYEKNREKVKARSAKRHRDKWQEIQGKKKDYYAKNRESIMAYQLKYAEENREKSNGWKAKNKARRLKAMPSWFGDIDQFVVDEAYSLAKFRAEIHGFEWHVDHRVPLCGDRASGLHCAANIQVIPATINLRKNNRLSLVDDLSWLYTKPPIP